MAFLANEKFPSASGRRYQECGVFPAGGLSTLPPPRVAQALRAWGRARSARRRPGTTQTAGQAG